MLLVLFSYFWVYIWISNYWQTSTLLNFIRWITFFNAIIIKHTESKLNKWTRDLCRCDSPAKTEEKSFHLSEITCVEVKSHLGWINPFWCKRFVFTKWNTPFCQDLAQGRRLTWVGWFFSSKQPQNQSFWLWGLDLGRVLQNLHVVKRG